MAVRGQAETLRSLVDQVTLSSGNGELANVVCGDLGTIPRFTAGTSAHLIDGADGENRNDGQQDETA